MAAGEKKCFTLKLILNLAKYSNDTYVNFEMKFGSVVKYDLSNL